MKKPKKIRYKRRLLIYTVLTVLIIFSIVDYYFETAGLPDEVAVSLREKFKENGLDIEFENVKLGVINGLVLTKPVLYDQTRESHIFKAEKLKIGFTFSPFSSYCFGIDSFELIHGHLQMPMFPDAGEEGEHDLIEITDVNATILLGDEEIDVKHFSGELPPFHFSAAGSLTNTFLPEIAKESNEYSSDSTPFSIVPLIKEIPLVTRSTVYRELLKFREGKFTQQKPECQMVFNLDIKKPSESFIKANIVSPAFTYGGFDIDSINATVAFKGYQIVLQKLAFQLPKGGTVKIDGMIDLFNDSITGEADLNVLPTELDNILQREKFHFPEFIKLGEKPMKLSANLQDFSLSSMFFKGLLKIEVPEAEIKGVAINNFKADLFINQNRISANSFSLSTEKNTLHGNFDYYPESKVLDVRAKANGSPVLIKKILHGENKKLVEATLSRFRFPEKQSDIAFDFDMHVVCDAKPFYLIKAKVGMNDFAYSGVNFSSGSTWVMFDSNSLFLIPAMTLQKENSLETVAMVYDNTQNFQYRVKSPHFPVRKNRNDRFIAEIDGNLPGNDVLTCIFPEWNTDILDLKAPTRIKAHGIIDFANMEKTLYLLEIIDSTCHWNDIPIEHVNADVFFKGFDMLIRNAHGKVYTGNLQLTYLCNLDTLKGKVDLFLDKADFRPIAKYIGSELGEQNKGKLSLTTKTTFYFAKDDNLYMDGKGKLWIREADLWDIPMINEFGELTKKWIGQDWGVISSLDADLEYKNNQVYSNNIHTDGTVISLSAKGGYYWNTTDYDFTIRAKVLEGALPFKLEQIFNPLTWLLETRVYRKDNKTKWEKIHSVKRLFNK